VLGDLDLAGRAEAMSGIRESSRARSAAALLGGAIAAAALGYFVATGDSTVVAAALVLLVFCLGVARPIWAASALLVLTFVLPWAIAFGGVPAVAKLAEDALALALLVPVLLGAMRPSGRGRLPACTGWVLLMLVAAGCSLLVGRQHAQVALLSVRTIWRFVPLLFAPAMLGWTDAQRRRLVGLVIALCLIQVPVALVQTLVFGTHSGDPMGGTLGANSSGTLTTLVIGIAVLLSAFYLYRAVSRPLVVFALAALCIPPAVNETKVFFIAAPLILGVMLVARLNRNTAAAVALCLLLVLGVAMVAESYSHLYGHGRSLSEVATVAMHTELQPGVAKGGELKRASALTFMMRLLARNPASLPFGFGAGSATISEFTSEQGSLIDLHGILLRSPVFAVRLALEFGVVAVVLFVGLMGSLIRTGLLVERRAPSPFWRAAGMGLEGFVITMLLLSFYTGTFAADSLAASMWILAGVVVAERAVLDGGLVEATPAVVAHTT
jgi:hypothetical protein